MSVVETEIRKLKIEFKKDIAELRKLIVTRLVADKWVNQTVACSLLNITSRHLCRIRIHLDANNNKTGSIGWRKGKSKNGRCQYYLPDVQKYNADTTIMK
jgi:hypothetical protein